MLNEHTDFSPYGYPWASFSSGLNQFVQSQALLCLLYPQSDAIFHPESN
jgi:hypothetical protein